jgi:hypothetical protein
MKIYKSDSTTSLIPKGKVILTVNGKDPENIWIAIDNDKKKMYLLNHALAFYPFPSWGSEWDLANSLDVGKAKGKSPDDTILTLHQEAYDNLSKYINDDIFDTQKFIDDMNSENKEK